MATNFSIKLGASVSSALEWTPLVTEENVTDPFPALVKGISYTFDLCSFSSLLSTCTIGGKCKTITLTAEDIPGPPLDLKQKKDFYQALTIGLTWKIPIGTTSTSILRYEIEASSYSDFSSLVQSSSSILTEVSVAAPTKGANYYCRVRAVTTVGRGEFSVYGPVISNSTPSAPSTISLVAGEDSNGNLFLATTWSIPADTGDFTNTAIDVISYELDFSNSSSFASKTVSVSKAPSLSKITTTYDSKVDSISDPAMQDLIKHNKGQIIFCRVRSRTLYGLSNNSSVVSRKLAGLPGIPESVKLSVLVGQALPAFNLSWVPPTDKGGGASNDYPLLRYRIQLKKTSATIFDTILVDPDVRFIIISKYQNMSLVRGDTYIAVILAENDVGMGAGFIVQQDAVGLSSTPEQVVLCSFGGGSLIGVGGAVSVGPAGPLNLW